MMGGGNDCPGHQKASYATGVRKSISSLIQKITPSNQTLRHSTDHTSATEYI